MKNFDGTKMAKLWDIYEGSINDRYLNDKELIELLDGVLEMGQFMFLTKNRAVFCWFAEAERSLQTMKHNRGLK